MAARRRSVAFSDAYNDVEVMSSSVFVHAKEIQLCGTRAFLVDIAVVAVFDTRSWEKLRGRQCNRHCGAILQAVAIEHPAGWV
jgi:hypothetical protein